MKLHLKETSILQETRENMLEVPNKQKIIFSDLIGKHVERLIKYIEMRYDHVRKWEVPSV
jgi:hypothetical protein